MCGAPGISKSTMHHHSFKPRTLFRDFVSCILHFSVRGCNVSTIIRWPMLCVVMSATT